MYAKVYIHRKGPEMIFIEKKKPKKWNNRQGNNLVPESILVFEPKLWVETKNNIFHLKVIKVLRFISKRKSKISKETI